MSFPSAEFWRDPSQASESFASLSELDQKPDREGLRELCRVHDERWMSMLYQNVMEFPLGEARDQEVELVLEEIARVTLMLSRAVDQADQNDPASPEVLETIEGLDRLVDRVLSSRSKEQN
mgnify:CR=1 FL=1